MKNYKRQIYLFLSGSMLIVLGSFAVLLFYFRKQVSLQNEIPKIEINLIQADSLTTNLLQIESGKRGFQLTNDTDYLKNFYTLKTNSHGNVAKLKKNIIAGAETEMISQVDSLLKLRIANLDSGIFVFKSKGFDASIAFMQIKDKKDTRELLNQKLNLLKNRLLQRLKENTSAINSQSNRNLTGLFILLSIFITLMLVAARTFRRAQLKIIKSYIKFKEAQRIAKIGSWEWDITTNKLEWSQEQFRLFGEDSKKYDLTFKSYLDHLSEKDQDQTRSLIKAALEGGANYAVEHEIIRKNGSKLIVFEQGTVLYDDNNKPTGIFGTTQDITHRIKTEEKLRLLQNKFQQIFDNTADGIYQSTIDGKFIMANPAMAKIFGYNSPNELIKTITDIGTQIYAYPDDRQKMSTLLARNDHVENFEAQLLTKYGDIVWVSESTRAVRNEKGAITCFEGTLKDISERKKAEEALNSSKEQYRQIVETAQEGIWVLDENNYSIFVNKKMCEILEYPREEIMGKQNYYFKDEEGKKKAMQDIERRKGGITETQITKFIAKSGKVVWTSVSTNPIFDDEGNYVGALGMFTDITERRKADEELALAQKKFQEIFDNTADGIYQSTFDGKFIMANRSMARIFGYDSPEEFIRSVTNIGAQIYADPVERKKMTAIILAEGHIENYELQAVTKKKEIIWVSVNIRIVKDETGNISYFEGTLEDITESKRSEEEILQLNRNLDQFANITAHDLQEPIRMVSGFLGLLDKKYNDVLDEQGKSYIYRAKDGADRMSILIRDLLEFSRSGNKAAKKGPVDLAVVMDLVNKDLCIVIEDTHTRLCIPSLLPVVTGIQSALYRLFLNLISNGIKFRKKDTAPEIKIAVKELPDAWEFSIQDNGIGVAENDQPKLFHAFQRLHRREEYPGTGLGLVTCKKIVETHGGKIWMVSGTGKGTTFHFTINKT